MARTPQQIGSIVRKARKEKGWSQSELGQKAGLRQGTVSQIETGGLSAKLDTLLAVLAALDLEFQITQRTKTSASEIEDLF